MEGFLAFLGSVAVVLIILIAIIAIIVTVGIAIFVYKMIKYFFIPFWHDFFRRY